MRPDRPRSSLLPCLLLGLIGGVGAAERQPRGHADIDGLQPLDAARHAQILDQIGSAQVRYQLEDGPGHWLLHEGDLHVPGDLDLDAALIVAGDLRIDGSYDDGHGDGQLIVLGDLQLEHAFSWGALLVRGDLDARGVVFAVYNDFSFEVNGKVNARGLVISDKSNDYRIGRIDFVLDDMSSDVETLDTQAGLALRHLQPELLTDPGHLELDEYSSLGSLAPDFDLARRWVREGRPLLRAEAAPSRLAQQAAVAIGADSDAAALAELLGGDPLLAQLVAARAEVPESLHAALIALDDPIVQEWMARVAPQASFVRRRQALTPELAATLAIHPDTETATLEAIAGDADPAVRLSLASRETLPLTLRERLANDAQAAVRVAFINDQLGAETIARRVADDAPAVRSAVAALSLDAAQVTRLLAERDVELRVALARGLRAQAEFRAERRIDDAARAVLAARLLDEAADLHSEDYQRRQIATDAFLALPANAQAERFADSLKQLDLEEIAEHSPSLQVMNELVALADQHGGVLPPPLGSNRLLPDALQGEIIARAERFDPDSVEADSYEPTPDAALEALLYNDRAAQLLSPARFGQITRLILDRGINPADGGLQNAYFHFKGFTPEAIEAISDELGNDEDWALTVLLQPAAGRAALSRALQRWYDDAELQAELRSLAKLDDEAFWRGLAHADSADLREAAAGNRHTPEALLTTLSEDSDEEVRYAACWNPRLPLPTAIQLAEAGQRCVLGHPALPLDTLRAIARAADTAEHRSEAYEALSLRLRRAE